MKMKNSVSILDRYLESYKLTRYKMGQIINNSESSIRSLANKPFSSWTVKQISLVSRVVNQPFDRVVNDLHKLETEYIFDEGYELENRRYIGNKAKLSDWIKNLVLEYTTGHSFFDVFAGTGIITKAFLSEYDKFIINDFLYSNEIIYHAFFSNELINEKVFLPFLDELSSVKERAYDDNYFENNYGGKFFSNFDARIIGEIRERIQQNNELNKREKAILIASLIYSADKCANTVGHYDAYRKRKDITDSFKFKLIKPLNTFSKQISIYREDSNKLVKSVNADIAFIDPPYNSRQYSRFYHVLENIAKWDKPKLHGVAMKPDPENISVYCKTSAPSAFDELIQSLDVNYIVTTYNNTYQSKSSSSKNKISHQQILESLNKVGNTKVFSKKYKFFNTGKTELPDHQEFLFITEVTHFES